MREHTQTLISAGVLTLVVSMLLQLGRSSTKKNNCECAQECKCNGETDHVEITEPSSQHEFSDETDFNKQIETAVNEPTAVELVQADENIHWMQNEKYNTCYSELTPSLQNMQPANSYLSFDEAHSRLAALRQRDKRCIDGAIAKNANYYKKHFGDELDVAENERWWGNDEY